MTAVRLIAVPYDSARADVGMGAGPVALLAQGLEDALGAARHEVTRDEVRIGDEPGPEIARTFAILRRLAERVAAAVAGGAFPLVLTGNCNACVGTIAGLGGCRHGVVWLDAHADFDVPDDNESGFFDVMALSILTGACWRRQAELVPGFAPVDEADVAMVGVRDLEPYQRRRLEASRVRIGAERPAGVDDVYLHLDLDVLDPSVGRANRFAAPGGLAVDDVAALVRRVAPVRAAALSAYDPAGDPEHRVAAAGVALAVAIADAAG